MTQKSSSIPGAARTGRHWRGGTAVLSYIAAAAALILITAYTPAKTLREPHPGIGTNLSQIADYSRELPFVDVFKTARPWIAQQVGAPWGHGPALQLDERGWVTSLLPDQYAETILLDNALDDSPHFPAGDYTLLYDGRGSISFDLNSAAIVSRAPGRMVVHVAESQNGVFLKITATDPQDYIRNIRFIMPGFEATAQSHPFNPEFLRRLSGFRVLRFMEWMLTNNSTVRNWSDRALPSDYTWTRRGVPLEVIVQLANTTHATPWFNIPAMATDDYVRQFAALLNSQLDPGLHYYVEYSNETWNGDFAQNGWTQKRGLELSLSADAVQAGAYYTSLRATQIFRQLDASRAIRTMASQAANSHLSDQLLEFRNASAGIDALAVAPYFDCDDTATGGFGALSDPSNAVQVDRMTPDQIIDIGLAHVNGCARQQMQANAAVAKRYGVSLVAYEGGQSMAGIGAAQNDPVLAALFITANRSPRMYSLYMQYLANWVAAGGDVFVHFTDVTGYTKFGNYGALEYQNQEAASAPKFKALLDFGARHP